MDRLWRDRRWLIVWQLLFLIFGTSWLLAPHLNHLLSYRTSLISQYENAAQPFSWLFRGGDVLAALLLLWLAWGARKLSSNKVDVGLLFIIGAGMLIDPLFATSCHVHGSVCKEYVTPVFVVHGTETIITAVTIFLLAAYDVWRRRRLVSLGFIVFQLVYGGLFVTQLADQDSFNTLSQYLYQLMVLVWLAWFGRDFLIGERPDQPTGKYYSLIKPAVAIWAFLNGLLAILISLKHLSLLGRLHGLYFAGNNAWLAQHGVIIGVMMIYLSRHLARGELRARQIFMAITGLEVLKYAVVTPHLGLLALYFFSFCALFVLRDVFDRGVVPISVGQRLQDAVFMLGSLLLAALLGLLALSRTPRLSRITSGSLDHFFDYTLRSEVAEHSQIRSALLAHTISAFLLAGIAAILWILFRPYKYRPAQRHDYRRVSELLGKYSASSEDYFKLWPRDKDYFWTPDHDGFIAYRAVGTTVFALADPVCAPAKRADMLKAFVAWARSHRWRVCFLPVFETSLELYTSAGLNDLNIGASALVSTAHFIKATSKDKWWRWQKNRSVKSGYEYRLSRPPHSRQLMSELKKVSDAWLGNDKQERGFALGYFDYTYLQQCDIHYLESADGTVAFTNRLPVFNGTTASIDLLRHLPSTNNAMPFLLLKTIESVAPDCKYFDLGFVPFVTASNPVITMARTLSAGRFSAHGLEQFKNKFDPEWQPNHLAYDGDLGDLALIAANLENAMRIGENPAAPRRD